MVVITEIGEIYTICYMKIELYHRIVSRRSSYVDYT